MMVDDHFSCRTYFRSLYTAINVWESGAHKKSAKMLSQKSTQRPRAHTHNTHLHAG